MTSIPSRIDPLSWAIFIDEPYPEILPELLWLYPSGFPIMRPIIHECIHFWHSISTKQGMSLAFDCLKSMNTMRFAARKGEDLLKIDANWTFDGYRPFGELGNFKNPGIRIKKTPFGNNEDDERREPFISPFHLFESLARYWDVTICEGMTTDRIISSLIDKESKTYSEAYHYAYNKIGDVSFILFPLFTYLALCTNDPVETFDITLSNYSRDGFTVPRGINFQEAWLIAWEEAAKWEGICPKPYGPMSCYKSLHKGYVSWKMEYPGLIPEDFLLGGHPILENSVHNMMSLARFKWPDTTDYDREVKMLIEFVFPGNPDLRRNLVKGFMPPVIRFSDGRYWINPSEAYSEKPDFFAKSMLKFSSIMGVAFGLIQRSKGIKQKNPCPCKECPIHKYGLCSFMPDYPDNYKECSLRKISEHEFGVV